METLLIVEDDTFVRDNLAQLLTLEGYNVLTALDGQEALKSILNHNPIDLIISDIMMPNIDGYEFIKNLQNNKSTKFIPIILLSAKTDNEEIRLGMNIGADDYLTKPFSIVELLDTVKARLKKNKAHHSVINELKTNIAKYVPHELRTPLVSILGCSDLLLDELDSLTTTEAKELIGTIKGAGLRLSEWVEKFIFYTEVETKFTPQSEFDADEITCDVKDTKWETNFENNRAWFERKKDIKIELENAELKIDGSYLEFIIKELVENSAKFSSPGTSIEVNGVKNDNYYKINFSDDGIGFTDSHVKNLTAFNQIDRENMQQYGNGLGLAIVNKIVNASKGVLDIRSRKNECTQLIIKIPLAT